MHLDDSHGTHGGARDFLLRGYPAGRPAAPAHGSAQPAHRPAAGPGARAGRRGSPNQPAFLIVHFQPQAIAEGGYYEATILPCRRPARRQAAAAAHHHRHRRPARQDAGAHRRGAAGWSSRCRRRRASRFTIEGVLDWSGLELSVNGIAAIGPTPTPAADRGRAGDRPPARNRDRPRTAVPADRFADRRGAAGAIGARPFTSRGRTELWHTRLQLPGAGRPGPRVDSRATRRRCARSGRADFGAQTPQSDPRIRTCRAPPWRPTTATRSW